MNRRAVFSLLGLMAALGLSGCGASNTEADFLCPVQVNGSPCSTIAEADGRGTAAVTPVAERRADTLARDLSQTPLGVTSGKASGGAYAAMGDGRPAYQAARYRVPEQVGTLWIAPHLDTDGLLHEATNVHFVVRPAQWASGRP